MVTQRYFKHIANKCKKCPHPDVILVIVIELDLEYSLSFSFHAMKASKMGHILQKIIPRKFLGKKILNFGNVNYSTIMSGKGIK